MTNANIKTLNKDTFREQNWHDDFPILKDLHYLDNASTTQKPKVVIDAITRFYEKHNANTHRGIYKLSEDATRLVEDSRKKISDFINSQSKDQIIFVRNTTEGMNHLASSLGHELHKGENIVITIMEHHSNLIPWQQLCKEKDSGLRVAIADDLSDIYSLVDKDTRIVSFTLMSNVTGFIPDAKKIIKGIRSKNKDTIIIADAAQAIAHIDIDVQDLDVDFLCFSMHKLYGPDVGVVYGRKGLLEKMRPFFYGGNMIERVSLEESTWAKVPERFEAGTVDAAGIYAAGIAIDYIMQQGKREIFAYENNLKDYLIKRLREIQKVKIIGHDSHINHGQDKSGKYGPVVSFTIDGLHPHDLASVCDNHDVCIRAGHHCCQPFMKHLGINATARASISFYNTKEDIDALIDSLDDAMKIFRLERQRI